MIKPSIREANKIKKETDLSKTIKCLSTVEKIWIMSNLKKEDSLTFEQFKFYSVNNDLSRLELTPEDQRIIYNEIDTDKNKTIDKEEMVIFFQVLLRYKENQDYEKLRSDICHFVFKLNYSKIHHLLKQRIYSDMLQGEIIDEVKYVP